MAKYYLNPPTTDQSWQVLFASLILVFMRKCFCLPIKAQLLSTLHLRGSWLLMNPSGKAVDATKYSFLEPVLTLIEVGEGSLTPRNSSSFFKNVSHVWRGGDRAVLPSWVSSRKGTSESSIPGSLWSLNRNTVMRKFSNFLCKVLNSQKRDFWCFIFSKTILQLKSSLQ